VREDGFALLLDCGSGAFAKLRAAIDYLDVDAVLITHMHPDHTLDLIPFACALSYSPRRRGHGDGAPRPQLHVPEGGRAILRRLCAAFDEEQLLERVFAASEYRADGELELGPLRARFCEVPHFVRAFAAELSRAGDARLTFGADCGPNEALERFAAGTDLLVLEATQLQPGDGFRGHMTAREAGELGRRAGARRLLVSHFSDELDADRVRSEASAGFEGEAELAREGAQYVLGVDR
jgi:ribonuclease BN (tRNA processing enzyme)